MIDLRVAVEAAHEYLKSVQAMIGNRLQDLRLEEVELSEDKEFWLITLGFDSPATTQPTIARDLGIPQRSYKVFKVNSETGEVEAMKIRKL